MEKEEAGDTLQRLERMSNIAQQIRPQPDMEVPLAELSFGRLTASIEWLLEAVNLLQGSFNQVSNFLVNDYRDLVLRIDSLEVKVSAVVDDQYESQQNMQNMRTGIDMDKDGPVLRQAIEDVVAAQTDAIFQERTKNFATWDDLAKAEETTEALVRVVAASRDGLMQDQRVNALAVLDEHEQSLADLKKSIAAAQADHKHSMEQLVAGQGSNSDYEKRLGNHERRISALEAGMPALRAELNSFVNSKDLEDGLAALDGKLVQTHAENAARLAQVESSEEELRKRLDSAEPRIKQIQAKSLDNDESISKLNAQVRELKVRQQVVEGQQEETAAALEEQEARRERQAAPKGPVTLESLGHVDLQEEVRRLRGIVECLEQSAGNSMSGFIRAREMQAQPSLTLSKTAPVSRSAASLVSPDATRMHGISSGGTGGTSGAASEAKMEERVRHMEESLFRDQRTMLKAVRHMEKEMSNLDEKVEDMWRRLPRAIALLEPLGQGVQGESGMKDDDRPGVGVPLAEIGAGVSPTTNGPYSPKARSGTLLTTGGSQGVSGGASDRSGARDVASVGFADAVSAEISGCGRSPQATSEPHNTSNGRTEALALQGLVRAALQSTADELRDNLQQVITRLRVELAEKVSSEELRELSSRLDAWTQHAPGCALARDGAGSRGRLEATDGSPSPLSSPDFRRGARPRAAPHGGDLGGDADKSRMSCGHDKCKMPTFPKAAKMAQSLSRLPALSPK